MLATLTLIVICFVSIVFFQQVLKKFGKYGQLEKLPGPMKFPIVGNSWYFVKPEKRLSNLLSLQSMYGNRVYLTGGGKRGLLLFHPDDVKKILSSKLNKSSLYDVVFTDYLGSSLLYEKEKEHTRKRKMFQPAVIVKRMDNFEESLIENSKTLIKYLKVDEANGQVIEIQGLLTRCALNIGFGMYNIEILVLNSCEVTCLAIRATSPWLWPDILWKLSHTGRKEKLNRKILQDTMDKIVEDSISTSCDKQVMDDFSSEADEEPRKKDILNVLDLLTRKHQENVPGFTKKYIRDELNGFVFATQVQKELEEVFGDDREGNMKICEFGKLKYLECCIKETMRLFPPVSVTVRSTDEDFTLDKDVKIPKGTEVAVLPWVTHRLSEFFPEPEKFVPSRFLPENSVGRHPYSYIPFSAGPRNCMGQKPAMDAMKMVLAHIFNNFVVKMAPGSETIEPLGHIAITPKDPVKIQLKSR